MTNKEQLASNLLAYKRALNNLNERVKKGKELVEKTEKQLLKLLEGTGETICCDNYEITCSSPRGSVEITADVPKEYCSIKEVLTPNKT